MRVYVCMCVVQIRGTDSLQLGVRAVCVHVCECVRISCLMQLDILTMLMRDQKRMIGEFYADFRAVKVTRRAERTPTPTHAWRERERERDSKSRF